MVERWNGTNGFIFFGKGGEVATNRLDDQEVSVLSLHLLQVALVYVNTLMLQTVLAEEEWMARMADEDFRALTPLIHSHVNPYGAFELDMKKRLPLDAPVSSWSHDDTLRNAHFDTSRWRETDQELKRHDHRFNRNPVPAL